MKRNAGKRNPGGSGVPPATPGRGDIQAPQAERGRDAGATSPAVGWWCGSLIFLFVALMLLGIPGCATSSSRSSSPSGPQRNAASAPALAVPTNQLPPEVVPPPTGGTDTTPLPTEELWIIARPTDTNAPPLTNDIPGTGALVTKPAEGGKDVPLVLTHTDVKARVSAYIASVEVTQQFQNPYNRPIDATYVFPLPHNAAVHDFLMTIGNRRIRGIIRERKEAEQLFAEARRQGYTASLLTQDRPNLFQQAVANIEPGKEIGVVIHYLHTLSYDDGWYEYVFPMVAGLRLEPRAAGQSSGEGDGTRLLSPHPNPLPRRGNRWVPPLERTTRHRLLPR